MEHQQLVDLSEAAYRSETFTANLLIQPEDRSLATATQIKDQIPSQYLEIFYRFCELGWSCNYGHMCIMQSCLLRRILRLHGFPASLKQVICQYENNRRGWQWIVGSPDIERRQSGIDTHMVVESGGFILDFGNNVISKKFGAIAPLAFIAESKLGVWQDLDFYGKVKYISRSAHLETRNQMYLCRNEVLDLCQQYFIRYRI